MPREGTRSQTGNSRPRIFHAIDTGPATTRKKAAKPAATKKNGSGGGSVMGKVKEAVGLEPREPKRVQKKSGVKRAVQKIRAAAKVDDKAKGKGKK